jgi:imidazolonepropionase-like amidohydrolase
MKIQAIVNAVVIDGTGRPPFSGGVMVIRGDRILAVGDSTVAVPAGATIIDAAGGYVIPGLMDANVHMILDFWPLTLARYEDRYHELAIEAAQVALRAGVTTVFDSWGPRVALMRARHQIASGEVPGARIYLAGNIVGLGGPLSEDFFPQGRESLLEPFSDRTNLLWQENVGPDLMWMSPTQVRDEIRRHVGSGIDFLKYAVTGHGLKTAQYLQFSPRVQAVIVEEAHRAGLTVQTHTTSNEGLHLAIEAGVDLMQHADVTFGPYPIPEDTLALIAANRVPCALLPRTQSALGWYEERGRSVPALRHFAIDDINDRALLKAGAILLLSTDGGLFSQNTVTSSSWDSWNPPEENLILLGEGHLHWLLAMEQKGMAPMAALLAATSNIARAYHVERDLGTLEVGKIADLVMLDEDPLISAKHYRSVRLVMKDGVVIDRDNLPTRRLLTDLK